MNSHVYALLPWLEKQNVQPQGNRFFDVGFVTSLMGYPEGKGFGKESYEGGHLKRLPHDFVDHSFTFGEGSPPNLN